MSDYKEKLAKEFEKIDWNADDISISEIQCWSKHERNDGGFVVRWQKPHCGFGELSFFLKDGKLRCHSECMSREFISKVMSQIVKELIIEE